MTDVFISKNMKLSLEFDIYLSNHPELYKRIPNKAYIIITTQDDPKFSKESLSTVKDAKRKTVIEAHKAGERWTVRRVLAPSV